MNKGKRVVITGIGLVNPLGEDVDTLWEAVRQGKSGLTPVPEEAKGDILSTLWGRVEELNPGSILKNKKAAKLMGRDSLLGMKAAGEALAGAGYKDSPIPSSTGLFVATGLTCGVRDDIFPVVSGAIIAGQLSMEHFGLEALYKCNPLMSFRILTNMPACHISIEYGFTGENLVFNPWPVQGAQAMEEACLAISRGDVEKALTGATESRLHLAASMTMAAEGGVPSEGAAFLMLEPAEEDGKVTGKVYAEIAGWGFSNAAGNGDDKQEQAVRSAIEMCLKSGNSEADSVGLVVASTDSFEREDLAESRVLKTIFNCENTAIWTPKALYGEMGVASFATAVSLGALALNSGVIPSVREKNGNYALILACENAPVKAAMLLRRWQP